MTRFRWPIHELLSCVLVLLMACAPAASSGPTAPPKQLPTQPTAGEKPAAAEKPAEWDQLVAAGKQEGQLVLLGPPNEALRTALTNTFGEQYGITVNYFGGSSELFARLQAERAAGQFTSDVVLNAAPNLLNFKDEFLDPLRPKLILPEVTNPSNWLDNHLWWVDQEQEKLLRLGVYAIVNLVVNADVINPQSIQSWDDVMDPQYRGKITSMTVSRAGPGAGTASYLWVALGEEKFKKLYVDQAVHFTDDARQAAESVARGTHPIGLGIDSSVIEPFRAQDLNLEVIRPPDAPGYLSSGWATLGLINQAPHPNAAQLFVNWAASREGGEVINRALESISARADVSNDWVPAYTRPAPGVKYVDTHSHEYLTTTRAEADRRVRAILGGS